jgi:N-glycosylase/DNA lyase
MQITIPTPVTFNFKRTAISHGWYDLPPFELDQNTWTITRVIDLDRGVPVTVSIRGGARGLKVTTAREVGKKGTDKIIRDVRHMLRLDDDMKQFYEVVSNDQDFCWIASSGAGRMLRSPTVFEDLVKMICTTNCSWALTDKMINSLVNALGRASRDGRPAFPTPEAMTGQPEKFYRDEVRAGYRAPYLIELARHAGAQARDEADQGRRGLRR